MRTTAETVVYPVESVVVVCTCLQQWLVLVNLKGLQAEKKELDLNSLPMFPRTTQSLLPSCSFSIVEF